MIKYRLVDTNNTEINRWDNVPERIDLPNGNVVFSPEPNWSGQGFTLDTIDVTEEIPTIPDAPPEEPKTPVEKLASIGLSVPDLKQLLGIS